MGVKGWQRLHNTNYVITGLAILHIILARGNYAEQYWLTGAFVWLMAWRVLARYRLGANISALMLLTLSCALLTALLEAGFFWSRRNYSLSSTLALNFNLDILDLGIPPGWQVLALGLLFTLATAVRQAFRVKKAARLQVREAGSAG
jgi:hypothetical protein